MKLLLYTLISLTSLFPAENYINPAKIRYGTIVAYEKQGGDIALVDSKKVYVKISEYQTIKKEGIQPGTARYSQLMTACTKKFRIAVTKTAKLYNYALVVEEGGVSKEHQTISITDKVIQQLSDKEIKKHELLFYTF
tara:strand:- start:706 stop:1116 length:411 start_codon:yes stop_codon:yes gene_type:complete